MTLKMLDQAIAKAHELPEADQERIGRGLNDYIDHLTALRVVVRIACRVCSRLAAKFGPEITLDELTARFSYDCLWRAEARGKRGVSSCGVYLPDLDQPRPPDLLPGLIKLRLIKNG
jgi:hypothetical protein